MTCSSVHISSWRGLWLLNFCHPPETICSGLHCWKEKTMGEKILSKFLGSSAWEMMELSVRLVRQDFAGSVIKMSTHVSSLPLKAHRGWISWGSADSKSPFGTVGIASHAWKQWAGHENFCPWEACSLGIRHHSCPSLRLACSFPNTHKGEKRTKSHKSLPKPMRTQHSISNS